jgi:hypothetical protein
MTLLLTRSFVRFPLHKRVLAFLGSLFFSLVLLAQPNLYEFDEELPWDQIVPQKIKSIQVMNGENSRSDDAGKSYDMYEFDAWGKLLGVTGYWDLNEKSGEVVRYEYDSLGRIVFEYKEGLNNHKQPVTYYYYSFHYDENGLLKTRHRFVGPRINSGKPHDSIAYHYDEKPRLVMREYYSIESERTRAWGKTFENGYGYDTSGRLIWRYGKLLDYPSDTTFIQYDHEGLISSEFRYDLVLSSEFSGYEEPLEYDSTYISPYEDPKNFVRVAQRTTHVWNGNTCEITTRSEGINPVDPNYTFQHDIYIYDEQKKIVAAGKKTKSEPRFWTRFFYTYYP